MGVVAAAVNVACTIYASGFFFLGSAILVGNIDII